MANKDIIMASNKYEDYTESVSVCVPGQVRMPSGRLQNRSALLLRLFMDSARIFHPRGNGYIPSFFFPFWWAKFTGQFTGLSVWPVDQLILLHSKVSALFLLVTANYAPLDSASVGGLLMNVHTTFYPFCSLIYDANCFQFLNGLHTSGFQSECWLHFLPF